MKHLISVFLAIIMFPVAYAQNLTQQDSINEAYNRIEKLQEKIQQQNLQMAKLSSDIQEVLKQNLAFKKNLNLSPTVASSKAGDIMDFRIIEVTGDSTTNEVHLVMIADNLSGSEKLIGFHTYQIIDDKGHGYENSLFNEIIKLKIKGAADQLLGHSFESQPDAPYTLNMYIKNYDPESLYIKFLGFDITESSRHYPVAFKNLPIKWQ